MIRRSEWPLDGHIVHKFQEMAKSSSPHGVEGIGNDMVTDDHIQCLTKYFFSEVRTKCACLYFFYLATPNTFPASTPICLGGQENSHLYVIQAHADLQA